MTQEDKDLLLKDLCARLPYGVKISWRNDEVENKVFELSSITSKKYESYKKDGKELAVNGEYIEWRLNENKMGKFYKFATLCDYIKPYLRPIDSMNVDDTLKFTDICLRHAGKPETESLVDEILEFYCSRHLDFHGLIPKGLALEAPEDMYK